MTHDRKITAAILARFHRDRLCPVCAGPVELDRETHCSGCKLRRMARAHLDAIETGAHNLWHELGIRRDG